jgi:hypothetical protein
MRRWKLLAVLSPFVIFVCCTNVRNLDGRGVLRDWISKNPITGAELELECKKAKLHGSYTARVARTITGPGGGYAFPFSATYDCSHVFIRPRKDGFTDTNAIAYHPAQFPDEQVSAIIPREIWMVPTDRAPWLTLEGLLEHSNDRTSAPTVDRARSEYSRVTDDLLISSRSAKTPQQHAWVREHYCTRTERLWAALGEEGKKQLALIPYYARSREEAIAYCGNGSG